MNSGFDFSTATRIIFGAGKAALLSSLVREMGARSVLLVTGKSVHRVKPLVSSFEEEGTAFRTFTIAGEPTVDHVRNGVLHGEGCDLVIGFGGGSVVDGAKAIAALLGNGGDPMDYIEVVGAGRALTRPSVPFVAVPTTAGTGSEVTRNAVLTVPEFQLKASLRSPFMLPTVAVVDPDLLVGMPSDVLRAGALDALCQNIEPYLSVAANPMTDALCREGIYRSAKSIRRAVHGAFDASAREDLALASLLGGLALANSGLGAVHGFAAPLGGMFNAPHGAICAALLSASLDVNHRALAARQPGSPVIERFAALGSWVTGSVQQDPLAVVRWVQALCADLSVPGLGTFGVRLQDVPAVVGKAKNASSMKKNPIVLTDDVLSEILTRSL